MLRTFQIKRTTKEETNKSLVITTLMRFESIEVFYSLLKVSADVILTVQLKWQKVHLAFVPNKYKNAFRFLFDFRIRFHPIIITNVYLIFYCLPLCPTKRWITFHQLGRIAAPRYLSHWIVLNSPRKWETIPSYRILRPFSRPLTQNKMGL